MGNLASNIGSAIEETFSPLWDFITNILDWLNPFSENFILKKLWDFLITIVDYLNPFSENFIGKYIVEAIGNILQFLFIPEDGFFENEVNNIKENLSSKIPYQDYINLFEDLKTVTSGESLSIDIEGYKIGDLTISQSDFIDFGGITKYKDTWFGWCRGITYIFMVIYNINQVLKLLRGFSVTDGSNLIGGGFKHDS